MCGCCGDPPLRTDLAVMTTLQTIEVGGVVLALLLMLDRFSRRKP
jgi:hypothetical protein